MKQVPMDETHAGAPAIIFSPDAQYKDARAALAAGEHEMVLRAERNALFEDEVACYIGASKVGTLHEEQAEYYGFALNRLAKVGIEAVSVCTVTERGDVSFRPLPEDELDAWVAAVLGAATGDTPEGASQHAEAPVVTGDPVEALEAPAIDPLRVGRQVMRLASLDWLDLADAERLDAFAVAPIAYEAMGLSEHLTRRQEDALVTAGYALHKAGSDKVHDRPLRTAGSGEETHALVIDDAALARFILHEAGDIDAIIARILDGDPLETEEESPVEADGEAYESEEAAGDEQGLAESTKQLIRKQRTSVVDRRARVAALVEEGKPLGKIAEELDVSTQTIRNDIRALGLGDSVVDGRSLRWSGRGANVVALVKEGKGISDICAELGMTESQVWKVLQEHG